MVKNADIEIEKVPNGRIWKIVETLIIAGIIGGITMWGTSQRLEERISATCASVARIETNLNTLNKQFTDHLVEHGRAGR